MAESFDHGPPGWIRQSRKCCAQLIHNQMVVDSRRMSSVNLAILDFCSQISAGMRTGAGCGVPRSPAGGDRGNAYFAMHARGAHSEASIA